MIGTATTRKRLLFMVQKSSTSEARRAVAKLTDRYFLTLKRELAGQTEEFLTRVETAVAANARDGKIGEDT